MSTARRTYAFVIAALLCCVLLFGQTAHMADKIAHMANLTPCSHQQVKLTVALPDHKAIASAISMMLGAFAYAAAFLLGVSGFDLLGFRGIAIGSSQQFADIQRTALVLPTQRGLFTLRI